MACRTPYLHRNGWSLGMLARPRSLLRTITVLLLTALGVQAQAQTFAVTTITPEPVNIGTKASPATGSDLYTTAPAAGALVTITCTGTGSKCGNSSSNSPVASITIQAGGITGRTAALKNFTVAAGTNSGVSATGGINASHTFNLTSTNFGNNHTRSFRLGAGFSVTRVGTLGTATAAYLVSATPGTSGASSLTRTFSATVSPRPLSIASGDTLRFGTVVKPTNATPTTITVAVNSPDRATFTVTGDYQKTFSASLASNSVAMTGPGPLQMALVLSHATGTLSSADPATADGTMTIGVGGSIQVTRDSVPGSYSGAITVIVSYN